MNAYFSESANGHYAPGRKYVPGETISGAEEIQRWLDKIRKPYGMGGPYRGLPDKRFILLNENRLTELLKIYDKEPWIRIAAGINMNAALGGSLEISDTALPVPREDVKEWRAFHYTSLVEAHYRCGASVGFTPWTVIPNSIDVGEGRVLPFSDMMSWFCRNGAGEPMFAFFRKPDSDDLEGVNSYRFMGNMVGEPIRNVYVTTWEAPDKDGDFNSIVASLSPETKLVKDFRDDASIANARLARPLFVSSHYPNKYDTKSLSGIGLTTDYMPGLRFDAEGEKRQAALAAYLALHREFGTAQAERIIAVESAQKRAVTGNEEGKKVILDPGQQLESQVLAQAPKDLIPVTMMHQQVVLTSFGVPPSFILSESARGKMASGDDSNAAMMFNNNQMKLKQQICQFLKQVFGVIHTPWKLKIWLMNQPMDINITEEQAERAVNSTVSVVLPGTPPIEFLKQLRKEGMLTYTALRKYVSRMHNIPLADLNEECELSLIDVITEGKESLQAAGLEAQKEMQDTSLEEQKEMQQVDVKAREKETKMKISAKPKTKPKAKAKAKSKKR